MKEKNVKENYVYIKFLAIPENERLARMAAAAFIMSRNPSLEEMEDVKTAVSEAVTNCVIHAYDGKDLGNSEVEMKMNWSGNNCYFTITDYGKGIEDISRAMEPLFTTKPDEERSGMGFSFMEAFMDELEVDSESGRGTRVKMMKRIGHVPEKISDNQEETLMM